MSCNHKKIQPAPAVITVRDSSAQNPYATLDRSPMDMSYFPADFPLKKMNGSKEKMPIARVIYSRPHKNGRIVFGNSTNSICHYGTPWRLGANEATEIDFYENVVIGGKNITQGSYLLYCIPFEDRWTIIFNSNLYAWGLHIDSSYDVFKTDIPVSVQLPSLEDFTMIFSDAPYGTDLVMAWDNVKVVLPIELSK
ncbi:MAG: DUF2911 domain-containing protein [Ferruginibacter sp.]